MPHQELSHRFQTAVYWPAGGYDDYGQPLRQDPVELQVRWEKDQREYTDPEGNLHMLEATVHVDRRIGIGSKMWLGSLSEWLGTGSGDSDTELMEVRVYDEIPDVKNRGIYREVGLAFYRASLPGTA